MYIYTINITKTIKKMSANDIRDFIYENYYKRNGFSKEDSYRLLNSSKKKKKDFLLFGKKLIDKVPDARNVKEHYDLFLRMKNRNSVKQLEIITYQQKAFQNPNIVDIKSVITEHPKIAHKLSKTVIQDCKKDKSRF